MYRFHRNTNASALHRLFLAFILLLSFAAADATANYVTTVANNTSTTANATIAANNSTSPVDIDKASFLCTYDEGITRLITIDKNIDTFHALQAEIAAFFPGKPAKFSIQYVVPGDCDKTDGYVPPYQKWRLRNYVDVVSDDDVRKLMAMYEALARASPNPVPIDLYVTVPHWWDSDWFSFLALICLVFMFVAPVLIMAHSGNKT